MQGGPITSFIISQYFLPATPPESGIFERATWEPYPSSS